MDIIKTARDVPLSYAVQRLILQICPRFTRIDSNKSTVFWLDELLAYINDDEIKTRYEALFSKINSEVLARDFTTLVDLFDNQQVGYIEIKDYIEHRPWSYFMANGSITYNQKVMTEVEVNSILVEFEKGLHEYAAKHLNNAWSRRVKIDHWLYLVKIDVKTPGHYTVTIYADTDSDNEGQCSIDYHVATVTAPISILETMGHLTAA